MSPMNISERMLKCKIVAPKKHLSTVIDVLYDLGLYHLTPHIKGNYELDIGQPLAEAEVLSGMIVKIRSILAKFPEEKAGRKVDITPHSMKQLQAKVDSFYTDLLGAEENLTAKKKQEEELHTYLIALAILKKLEVDISALQKSPHLAYF